MTPQAHTLAGRYVAPARKHQENCMVSPDWQKYSSLSKALSGTGLRAHHIIEGRFAGILGLNANNMLSVAVDPTEHQVFTNAWRAATPYGSSYAATTAYDLWIHAQRIYAEYPALLAAAKAQLGIQG